MCQDESVPPPASRTPRRTESLSKQRIVDAATEILDAEGESGLTFRALTKHLGTGAGAVYWHVADKDELLAAAADDQLAGVVPPIVEDEDARQAIRTTALVLFETIDAHPWVGTQLANAPWGSAMLRVFESIGRRLQALGVPEPAQFDSATALLSYILGVAGQNASNARSHARGADRPTFLATVATRWTELDPEAYPFVHAVAAQLADHDDREQFLAGVDLILAGIDQLVERSSLT